jgi:hypothetical protein
MCMTCGCGEPMNRHGDDANITYDQLQAAANAAGIDPEKAADNIHDLAKKVRDEGMPQESPVPPDAPVETPEADPRTEGAPDPERPASVPADPDTTGEQVQEAFE